MLVMVLSLALFSLSVFAKTKIVHWQHHSPARLEMVKQFAREFEKQYDVEIDIQSVPLGDYYTKLLPSLAAGSGPDIFQIRSTDVPKYVKWEVIASLNENVISYEQIEKDFIPGTIKYFKADGKYYALPTDIQTIVLFYNTEIFKEENLTKAPETWDELIAYAQKIHKRDESGMTTKMGLAHGSYGPAIWAFIAQTGTEFMKDGKALFDNEEAYKAFKFTTDWVVKYGVEDLDFGSRWTAFRQGELGMVVAHPAMLGSFRNTHPDLSIGIAELPALEKGGKKTNVVTNWAYVMSKRTENKELVTKWIAFLTSEEAQLKWAMETGELPARKALLGDKTILENEPLLEAPLNSLENAIPYPFEAWIQMDTAVRKAVQKVTIEGQDARTAFDWLVKESEKIYREVIAAE